MAGGLPARALGGLHVVNEATGDPASDQVHPLLGDALEVERGRQAGPVEAVVPNAHLVAGDLFAEPHETALFLGRQGAEPHEAHELEHLRHGIFLEHHLVDARLDRVRILVALRLVDHLGGQLVLVQLGNVDGAAIRVARPSVAHDDRIDGRLGGALMVEDPERVGNGELPGAGAERAEGFEPGASGVHANRLDKVGPLLRGRRRRRIRPGLGRPGRRGARHRNHLAARLQVGDGDRPLQHVGGCRLVQLVDRRHAGLAVLHHPYPDADVALGDVLVDPIVGEAREGAVPLGDHYLGLLRG